MILSVGVYSGLMIALSGITAGLLRFPAGTRAPGIYVFGFGLALTTVGLLFPAREKRIPTERTRLDQYIPRYQFSEFHSSRVDAPPHAVYAALKDVTPSEMKMFGVLTWIRRLGRSEGESILNVPSDQPIIAVATRTGFNTLADEPDRELVVGTHVTASTFAAMNFLVVPDGAGSVVTTETRIFAANPRALRNFQLYWRMIHPGSALIRRSWLKAIRHRAERPQPHL